ncbi:TPA: hypothetical protein ACN6ZQ_002207 [Escherichia albertii]|uniref:hypothetical protein n=1 Tax=Escherichia albertii TaxID=208962 RepID=UPI000422FC96|nr:hypothetical protein [Escherichia albertii]MCZ8723611.1 hypothetical protein [Escherichia albertii]MCZ8736747.1 hypothetical protein [Escherichia albertii]MCZ8802175.1 hypothetical protein [Escherichia albertii]MCZ8905322.1 hypothetical protein [Escherichia albertii]
MAQTWEEVLQDEQAWAIDVFYSMKYANGSEKALVRPPISLRECGLPDYLRAPLLGENTPQILRDLGYSEAEITQLEADNDIAVWRD